MIIKLYKLKNNKDSLSLFCSTSTTITTTITTSADKNKKEVSKFMDTSCHKMRNYKWPNRESFCTV